MFVTLSEDLARQAAAHLSASDAVLAPVIASAGLCVIAPHREYYQALVEEIIGQQLHVKAAASIRQKFRSLFTGDDFPMPAHILEKSVDELRTAGLSRAKASYIRDIAEHVQSGKLVFDDLDDLSNDEIIAKLTDVKGIGEWTAHMFLMFCMGRPDVLATGDFGIRSGIKKLYGLAELPTPQQVRDIARQNHWQPYETVACWYIWHSLDNMPV